MPRRLGIVFTMPMEERGLTRVLQGSSLLARRDQTQGLWHVGGVELITRVSGVGREQCARATEALIDSGAKQIICAGFAAALDFRFQPGDVFVAERVLSPGGKPIPCAASILTAVPPSGTLGITTWRGDLVTVDSVVCTTSEKSALAESTGGHALDMESYAAAEVCRRRGVAFGAVRAFTDTADENLPEQVMALARMGGFAQTANFVVLHPALWPTLRRFRKRAEIAASNLGDVLGLMLLRLV